MSLVGNLEDLSLPDILQIVSLSKKSGVLTLEREEIQGRIFIRDGKVIPSRGPGTAMDFALELIEVLEGRETRDTVEGALQRP